MTTPEAVRADFRRYEGEKLLEVVARTRPARGFTPDHVCRLCLKRLAQRAQELAREIADIDTDLEHLTRQSNPALMSAHGVGPVVAGTLLSTLGDNPDRVATTAQFAALCGVAPIPASSGVRHRHRLSRGGDRQANAALHRIVLSRRRHKDPCTMAYFDKRRAEGLSDRDIVRCLKRHVANEIFALLTRPEISTPQGPLLRQRRRALPLAMTEVALQLGVPYQRLRRLETGERSDAKAPRRLPKMARHPHAANSKTRSKRCLTTIGASTIRDATSLADTRTFRCSLSIGSPEPARRLAIMLSRPDRSAVRAARDDESDSLCTLRRYARYDCSVSSAA